MGEEYRAGRKREAWVKRCKMNEMEKKDKMKRKERILKWREALVLQMKEKARRLTASFLFLLARYVSQLIIKI